jgi:type I restriction enzyme S subunit
VNNHAHIVRGNGESDTRFLMYALSAADISGYLTGSTMPKLTQGNLNRIPLLAPPLIEQRAIAHILGTLDDKVELNQRMNETLEAMARALFKSWFVDFDPVRAKVEGRDPGLPQPLADLFPDSFEDSELGEIPRGWGTGCVDDLAAISSGKRPGARHSEASAEANVPLWGGNGPMGFVPSALIEHPILLTGRVGTLGVVFRVTMPCWPSDNTLIIRAKDEAAFEYLLFQLRQIDFRSLNRGSTQPLLTQTDLKVQPLVFPPAALLAHFHGATCRLYRRVDEVQAESRTLAALRDALLPKLISGELRLKDAEKWIQEAAV